MPGCTSGTCGSKGGGYGGGYRSYGYGGFPGYGYGASNTGFGGYSQHNLSTTVAAPGGPGCCISYLDDDQLCQIKNKVQDLIDCQDIAGAAVGLLVDGKCCHQMAFGQKTEHCDDLMKTDTLHYLGGMSDVFTSVALAEALSTGMVRMDGHVTDYIHVKHQDENYFKSISELAAGYVRTNAYHYLDWAWMVGCYHYGHLAECTDYYYHDEIEEFGRGQHHVHNDSQYSSHFLVKILKKQIPLIGASPLRSCNTDCDVKPLSDHEFTMYLNDRYGFNLIDNRDEFLAQPNKALPLWRDVCGQGDCDPCRPCNSCCSKKSSKDKFQHRFLHCADLSSAWNKHGSLEDVCRAMEILLGEGLPEDDPCDNSKCYPDLSQPFFCSAAFTQMFTHRHGVVHRDCNSVQTRSSMGALWRKDFLTHSEVWWIDDLTEHGTSHIALLDKTKCMGVVILTNTLNPTAHALAAYIYTVMCFGDCDLAQLEFVRVWNQYFTYINNMRVCQPLIASAASLRDYGTLDVQVGSYRYGNFWIHIECDDHGYTVRVGACLHRHRLQPYSPGTWVAHVQDHSGQPRLMYINPGGGQIGTHQSINVKVKGREAEFILEPYDPINKGFGMFCCSGHIDRLNSREENVCDKKDPLLACTDCAPKLPDYHYGGLKSDHRNAYRREYLNCYSCTGKPPVATDGAPCGGYQPYGYGGAYGGGIDPSGIHSNLDDCHLEPLHAGYGVGYGYGGGYAGGFGGHGGHGKAGGYGGCATGNCGAPIGGKKTVY